MLGNSNLWTSNFNQSSLSPSGFNFNKFPNSLAEVKQAGSVRTNTKRQDKDTILIYTIYCRFN